MKHFFTFKLIALISFFLFYPSSIFAQTYNAGNALSFDGTNDYVSLPTLNLNLSAQQLTVESWVYIKSYKSYMRLIDFGNGEYNNNIVVSMSNGTSGRPFFEIYNGSTSGGKILAPTALTLNQWIHLAFVQNGTVVTVYKDGVFWYSGTTSAVPTITRYYNYIGRSNWGADGYAHANYDEIRIWNVARSLSEIQRDMNSLVPKGPGLIAHYHCDEGSGFATYDYSGSVITGSLLGGTSWINSGALIYSEDPSGPMAARGYSNSSKIQQLTNGSYYNITSPYFEWSPATSGSGINGYSVALTTNNADTLATTVNVTDTSYTASISTTGIYYLRIRSRNNNGDWNRARTVFTYKLDITPPATFTLVSPTNGSYTDATPDLDWNSSSDAESGLARYRIYIDNFGNQFDSTTVSYYTVPTGRALAEGTHSWRIVAVDNAGNTRQSTQTYSFLVDATAPQPFNLLTPVNNTWSNSEPITLTWQASSDAGSGIAYYNVYVDSVLSGTTTVTSIEINNLADKNQNWYVIARDNVGNTTRSNQTNIVKLDRIAPEVNNSMDFGGTDDYIQIPHASSLMPSNNLTVEAWVRFYSGGSGNPRIIAKDNSDNDGYQLYTNGTGSSRTIVFRLSNTSVTSSSSLSSGTWYHLAGVYDGANVKLYINGVLNNSVSRTGTISSNTRTVRIGMRAYNLSDDYYGDIDEVRIWNYARSQNELQDNYKKMIPAQSGLVGYWRFNETNITSTTVNDYSGYNNHGTIIGSVQRSQYGIQTTEEFFNVVSPSYNQYLGVTNPTFTWNKPIDQGIGLQKYQFYSDGSLKLDNINANDTFYTYSGSPVLNEGSHSWRVVAYDSLGNYGNSETRTYTIDLTPPNSFNLTSPADGAYTTIPTPNFTWQSTTDGSSGMRKYQLWIDGAIDVDSIPIGTTTTAPNNPLSEGAHTWFIRAYDNVGNYRNSATRTIYGEYGPPTSFNLISPAEGDTAFANKPLFKWNRSFDYGTGLNRYELWIDGVKDTNVAPTDTQRVSNKFYANGPHSWYVKAIDGANNSRSSNTINNFVIDNRPPQIINPISDVVYPEDSGTHLVVADLKTVFSDGGALVFTRSVIGNGITAVISGDSLRVTTKPDSFGVYTVIVTATDDIAQTAKDTFTVTITNVNDSPVVINPVTNRTINEDAGKVFVTRMNTVFRDADGDVLTYSAVSSNASKLSTIISNDSLYISTVKDSNGILNVFLSATDPSAAVARDTFQVTITAINDAPFISNSLRDTTFSEDFGRTPVILLSQVFSDVDNTTLNYSATNLTSGITPSVSNDTLYLNSVLNYYGNVNIKVSASDGSLSVLDTFMVTITNVNDPPHLQAASRDTIIDEDAGKVFLFKMTSVFGDIDGDMLTFDAVSSNLTRLSIQISNDSLYVNTVQDSIGETLIYLSATDPSLAIAKDTFQVTINPVNDAPYVVNALRDTTYLEDFGKVFVVLISPVFHDIDNPNLSYTALNLSPGVNPHITNDSLYLNSVTDFYGNVNLKVTASDGSLSVSDTFMVTITNVNDTPQTFSLIAPQDQDTLPNWNDPVHFLWHKSIDADMDVLTYVFRLFGSNIDTTISGLMDTNYVFNALNRLLPLTAYFWTAIVSDGFIQAASSDTFQFNTPFLVGIEDDNIAPIKFAVHPNYPNPFNPTTTIKFDLPNSSNVTLKIYNLLGQEVRTLVSGNKQAGYHSVIWDGKNNQGQAVSSGVYLYRLESGTFTKTMKLMLLK